jgi:FkbM family methyltransferase
MGEKVRLLGGSIVSIEPVPFNLHRQREIIKLNGLEDMVEIVECALGAEKSVVKINADPIGADNNAIISGEGNLEVPVELLDSIVADRRLGRIGLIKIDVEGYEPKVIEGAIHTIGRDRPIIFAEFNKERMAINNYTIASSWELLVGNLNYLCRRRDEKNGRLRIVDDPDSLEDLYFIPHELSLPPDLL